MRRACWLIPPLLLLLIPSAAAAASVEITTRPGYCGQACSKYGGDVPPVHTLVVSSQADERNLLTIEQNTTGWTVRDGAAPLAAATGCRAVDANAAACDGQTSTVRIDAGAGDDEVAVTVLPAETIDRYHYSATPVYVDGGPGNDVLRGGAGDDLLDGGGGRDRLIGGAGDDLLDDQDGAAPDADTFDGGGGSDDVWYADRRSPVRVDLARAAAAQGQAGEGDKLVAIEGATGGTGDDVLAGGRRHDFLDGRGGDDRLTGGLGSDRLLGGPGRDELSGGGGDDELTSGAGADRLAGGAGNDELGTRDDRADRVACGTGRDLLAEEIGEPNVEYTDEIDYDFYGPDASDLLGRDCERARVDPGIDELTVEVRPRRVGASAAVFDNPCRKSCERGRLVLTVGRREVGDVRFPRVRRMPRIAVPLTGLERGRAVQVSWRLYNGLYTQTVGYRTVLR